MISKMVQALGKVLYVLLSTIVILFVSLFAYTWINGTRLLIVSGESIPLPNIIILILLAIALAGFIARFFNPKRTSPDEIPLDWNQDLVVCFSKTLPFALLAIITILFTFGYLTMGYIPVLGIILLLLGVWLLWVGTKIAISIWKKTPQLVINSKGIWDSSYGDVPWSDIKSIWLSEFRSIYTLEIEVTDIKKYLSCLPRYKYYLNKLEISPKDIHIQLNRFDQKPQFIFNCAERMLVNSRLTIPPQPMSHEELVIAHEQLLNQIKSSNYKIRMYALAFLMFLLVGMVLSLIKLFSKGFSPTSLIAFAIILLPIILLSIPGFKMLSASKFVNQMQTVQDEMKRNLQNNQKPDPRDK